MKNKIIIGVVVLALILAGIYAVNYVGSNVPTGSAVKITSGVSGVKEFNVKAFQFGYDPDVITVKKGEKVRIKINNTDVPHGIRIPELDVKDENQVEFTADKAGEFAWYCTIFCGEGHRQMSGRLIVK